MSVFPEQLTPGATSTGAYAARRRLLGSKLDGRTKEAMAIRNLEAALLEDLDDPPAAAQAVAQLAARELVWVGYLDDLLAELGRDGIVYRNGDEISIRRILEDRRRVGDSVLKKLQALGLRKQSRPSDYWSRLGLTPPGSRQSARERSETVDDSNTETSLEDAGGETT